MAGTEWVEGTDGGDGVWWLRSGSPPDWTPGDGRLGSDNRRFVTRFVDVPVAQGAEVISATITYEMVSSSTSSNHATQVAALDVDDSPVNSSPTVPGLPTTATVGPVSGSPRSFDVTSLIRAITGRPGWVQGNAITFLAQKTGALSPEHVVGATLLTVEYVISEQHVDTVTVPVAVAVGAVEVELSLTPVTVGVPVSVGRVDVVAPRHLDAARVAVPVAVGVAGITGTGSAPPLEVAARLVVPVRVGVALLALTIPPPPPPIPWRRLVTSPQYRAALDSRRPVTDARVEIINPDGAVIATLGGQDATHPGVIDGSVTCRSDAAIRWECDLTIDNPDLIPRTSQDLLHPLAHNRVRVWWRIRLDDGTWGEIPVGTYYIDWPAVSDSGGATVAVRARGSDPVAELKRARYVTPVEVGGMYAHDAISRLIEDGAPWAVTALTPSTHRLPEDYEAGEPGGDRVDDILKIAAAAGMEFYADRMGTLTLAPLPDSAGAPAESFIEGPGCAMTELAAQVNLDRLANVVTVASTTTRDADGNDIEPVTARATDNDPTSPLSVDRGHIYSVRIESDEITTQAQADLLAQQALDEARAIVDQVEVVHFARPHIDPGDVVEISRDRAAVSGARQVVSWTLGLGDLSGQRTVTTGRRGLT